MWISLSYIVEKMYIKFNKLIIYMQIIIYENISRDINKKKYTQNINLY